jgi:hypothetical protein
LSCASAREQPAGVGVGRGAHVVPVADPAEQEVRDWHGDRGGWVTETEEYLVTVADDVVDGQPDDTGEGLGVEQDDDRGDPGSQRRVGVGEDAAEHV